MNIDNELINKVKIKPLLDTLQLEDISDDDYFSKYANYISNSRLGKLKSEGAKAFFEGLKNEYSPSFEFGTLLHQRVLQPESYEVVDGVFKPTAKAGLMADALYKSDGTTPTDDEIKSQSYVVGYYRDKLTANRLSEFRQKAEPYWRDRYVYEQNNPKSDKERIYTNKSYFQMLNSCLEALDKNKDIQKLLHPVNEFDEEIKTYNEKTIFLDIEMTAPDCKPVVYKLKAKLDNFYITEDSIIVNDLKTTSRPVAVFDPNYYSYYREIAGYSWLLKYCADKFFNIKNPSVNGNFLVVSTIPDFATKVVSMNKKDFANGWKEYIYLLKTVAVLNQLKGYEF